MPSKYVWSCKQEHGEAYFDRCGGGGGHRVGEA